MNDDNDVYLAPHTSDPIGFCRWLGQRWKRAYEDRRRESFPAASNYASSLGHDCLRHLWYQRTGAERKPFEARTMMVFERGNTIERETVEFMRAEMEIDWVRSQQSAPKDSLNIGMKIDGGIRGRHNQSDAYLIAEIKTMNSREFARITDCDVQGIHDMLSASWWIKKYPFQGVCYLHYLQEDAVIFVLRDPSSWGCKFVPLLKDSPIYLQLWDEIQTKAKAVNAAVASGECPEPIPFHKSICGMCDYADTACHPTKHNEGVEVLTHPDVVKAAREFMDIKDSVSRANGLKEYLREIVLQTGNDRVIIGDSVEATVRKAGKGKAVKFTPLDMAGDLLFDDE